MAYNKTNKTLGGNEMKGLLIWLIISIPALSGALYNFGDGEELWNEMHNQQEEVVTEVKVETKEAEEIATLEEIEDKLEGMSATEMQLCLTHLGIEYSLEEVTGYPYKQWCIVIPEGEHLIHIHWYNDKVHEVSMGIEKFGDNTCPNTYK